MKKSFKKIVSLLSAAAITGAMCCANLAGAAQNNDTRYYIISYDKSFLTSADTPDEAIKKCKAMEEAGAYVQKVTSGRLADVIFVLGDVNYDKRINKDDVKIIRDYLSKNSSSLSKEQALAADITNNGIVDIIDQSYISIFAADHPNWIPGLLN